MFRFLQLDPFGARFSLGNYRRPDRRSSLAFCARFHAHSWVREGRYLHSHSTAEEPSHQVRESWRDAAFLRGDHPDPLAGLDGLDSRRRPRFRCGLVSCPWRPFDGRVFVLEGNFAFLFHHRRGEPTRELRTARDRRHVCAWPDPSRGAGRAGCRTLRLSRQAPVYNPSHVHGFLARIGEGNTTFLDPVAEHPIDSRLPVCSGCRHTCSVPNHHRDGGRGGLRTSTVCWRRVSVPIAFSAIISLSSSRDRRNSQTLRTWDPDARLGRQALSPRFPAKCDRCLSDNAREHYYEHQRAGAQIGRAHV